MKHLQQPAGSRTCGEHCVAMALGKADAFGICCEVGRWRGTYYKDLSSILTKHGMSVERPRRVRKNQQLPRQAIVRVRTPNESSHWVYKKGDTVYDPGLEVPLTIAEWAAVTGDRITSFMEIY